MEKPNLENDVLIIEKYSLVLRFEVFSFESRMTLFNNEGVHHINIKGHEKEIIEILSKRVEYLEAYKKWKEKEE
jgi:hypothetical protein